ncbi:aspartyl-phosphate phosphatase Spo0E family protein [Neobacillus cucumis]|uniref:aspartyl-phosphate phosphatase Spo0E family protein n=1 Tax=Neobacillus cucumis TaxID=1740721 RepID=UPI0028534EFB|nr:aspartyl-phosphate phosphatase Spo0E family protein [Neobacillus cucumis]MDR4949110.1 aspartyl-phosphate phosphatase Spo0E family protein [Neobacillus cucumis]
MKTNTSSLLLNIESTRLEMIQLARQFGYANPNVVKCSQKLDSLLNVYHSKMIKNKLA